MRSLPARTVCIYFTGDDARVSFDVTRGDLIAGFDAAYSSDKAAQDVIWAMVGERFPGRDVEAIVLETPNGTTPIRR